MTWTPYGPTPADLQHKDLASILASPSLTPEQAYNRATPAQRRAWFGDEPPTKAAGPYDLPPAAPVGLPPHLEAAVRDYQLGHYAEPVCSACQAQGARELYGGRCKHRPTPAQLASQRRWEAKARATTLVQQLAAGMIGNPVRVVTTGQAAQEDSMRAGFHAMIEELFG